MSLVEERGGAGRSFRALLWFWRPALAAGLGLALFFGAAVGVDRLELMPTELRRIVAVKRFLDEKARAGGGGDVFVLGSSVTFEGIDASVLDRDLGPERQAFNLAWTGGSPRQWLLIFPSLARARPAATVMCVDLGIISNDLDLPEARLNLAALDHFLEPADLAELGPLFRDAELERLTAAWPVQLLKLRALPFGALDSFARETARTDLRLDGFLTNFKSPWVRAGEVSPVAVEKNLKLFEQSLASVKLDDHLRATEQVSGLAQKARAMGLHPIVLLVPAHPRLLQLNGDVSPAAFAASLADRCRQDGLNLLDYSALLGAEDFADADHPNRLGREKLSARLGPDLAVIVK